MIANNFPFSYHQMFGLNSLKHNLLLNSKLSILLEMLIYKNEILFFWAPSGIGRETLVGGIRAACGSCQMLPHLLVVGAGNSDDPDPVGSGKRPSGDHGGGGQIGEEIGPPRCHRCLSDTNLA